MKKIYIEEKVYEYRRWETFAPGTLVVANGGAAGLVIVIDGELALWNIDSNCLQPAAAWRCIAVGQLKATS